jgi:hypothetical protein
MSKVAFRGGNESLSVDTLKGEITLVVKGCEHVQGVVYPVRQ